MPSLGISNILSKSFLSYLSYRALRNGFHLRFSCSIAIENVGIVRQPNPHLQMVNSERYNKYQPVLNCGSCTLRGDRRMKYYVYVSDTKIDMLYSQIPQNILRKIAAELNINLGVFNVNLKEKENREKTRYEKLNLVLNYIENNMDLGTIDRPQGYFKDLVQMRWGPSYSVENSGTVFFGGRTSQTILCLGGSWANVIGSQRGGRSIESLVESTAPPRIIKALEKELISIGELDPSHGHTSPDRKNWDEQYVLKTISSASETIRGPLQPLEFLAKRLVEGTRDEWDLDDNAMRSWHVLLGTPLYVALAD